MAQTEGILPIASFWVLAKLTNASFEDMHVRLSRLLYVFNFKNVVLNARTKSYSQYVGTFGIAIRRMSASPLTVKVQRADRKRDKYLRNIPMLIKVGLNSSDPEVVAAAETMWTIYKDYHNDATSQMGAQTELVEGLLRNATSDTYFPMAKKLGLLPTFTSLEQANDEFSEAYTERYKERESRPELGLSSRELRRLITQTSRECVDMLNAIVITINMGGESEEDKTKLEALIHEINALFRQYRLVAATQGRKRPLDEDQEVEQSARELVAAERARAEAVARHDRAEAAKMDSVVAAAEKSIARAKEELAVDNAVLNDADECACESGK